MSVGPAPAARRPRLTRPRSHAGKPLRSACVASQRSVRPHCPGCFSDAAHRQRHAVPKTRPGQRDLQRRRSLRSIEGLLQGSRGTGVGGILLRELTRRSRRCTSAHGGGPAGGGGGGGASATIAKSHAGGGPGGVRGDATCSSISNHPGGGAHRPRLRKRKMHIAPDLRLDLGHASMLTIKTHDRPRRSTTLSRQPPP